MHEQKKKLERQETVKKRESQSKIERERERSRRVKLSAGFLFYLSDIIFPTR